MSRSRQFSVLSALLCLLLLGAAGCRGGLHEQSAARFLARWKMSYNSHDLPSFTALYAEKGHYAAPPMLFPSRSRQALLRRLNVFWRQRPDIRIQRISNVVAGGNEISFLWLMHFTAPRTKRPVAQIGASFMKIENGRIVSQLVVANPPVPVKR